MTNETPRPHLLYRSSNDHLSETDHLMTTQAEVNRIAVVTSDHDGSNPGCGCESAPPSPARSVSGPAKAGLIGLLCVLGCAAGPLFIGGIGAATGAFANELWIVISALIVAVGIYAYRRRTGRRAC